VLSDDLPGELVVRRVPVKPHAAEASFKPRWLSRAKS